MLYDNVMPPTLSVGLVPRELKENRKWRKIREIAWKDPKIM
jgi:hypothetical protein